MTECHKEDGPPLVEAEEVKSWRRLRDVLQDREGWYFRGHCSDAWHLQSTLERLVPAGTDRAEKEAELLHLFQQAAANYLPSAQIPTRRIDWFAAMQHHGAPTRLVDFTRSPYVAAYFAVEGVGKGLSCALWAIDANWCTERANARLHSQRHPENVVQWLYGSATWSECSVAMVAGPWQMSARQLAQQAVFLVPGDLTTSMEQNLRDTALSDDDLRANVKCYRIPHEKQGDILKELRLMNITRATLFPGLDGFAQSLTYRLLERPVHPLHAAILGAGNPYAP